MAYKPYDDDTLRRLIDGDPSMGLIVQQSRQHRKRFAVALQRDQESVQEAGMLGYQARIMVQCSLPYRRQLINEWTRRNGQMVLSLLSPHHIGLPYGAYPRLLLTWVTTEAVRTQKRQLFLRESLTRFMADLGIAQHADGRQMQRFKDQTRRLFNTTITSTVTDATQSMTEDIGFRLASHVKLWWTPWHSAADFSEITLTEEFFRLITDRPVPVDLRVLQVLKGSALALDIYSWLVYRLSYLKQPTIIPWAVLQTQFGNNYAPTKGGRYMFKKDFQEQLREVLQLYSTAHVTADSQGVTLQPSRLHITRRPTN